MTKQIALQSKDHCFDELIIKSYTNKVRFIALVDQCANSWDIPKETLKQIL